MRAERAAPDMPQRRLWANTNFVGLFLVGGLISVSRWLEMLAVGIYVYEITRSAFVVALMTVLRMLPLAVLGPVLGAVADRYSKRRLLCVGLGVMFMIMALLWGLSATQTLALWHLYVAMIAAGVFWVLDFPVRRVLLGDAVPSALIGRAMAFDTSMSNGSRAVGPLMAGILLQFAGISGAFALSMAVYAVSLALLLWLTTPQSPPTPASQSMLQSIRSSFGYIFKSRTLVGILLVTVIYNIFGFPATAMVPVIGRDYLHLAPSGVGVLASMEGVGITIGGLLIASLVSARAYRSVYALGLALCMAGWLIFATVDHAMIAALWLVAAGIGAAGFSSMQSSLLILNTTGQYRSRIFGVLSVCVGTAPIGFLQIGLLAEFIGAPTAVIVSSCAGVLALIVLRLYWPGMLAAQSAEVDAN